MSIFRLRGATGVRTTLGKYLYIYIKNSYAIITFNMAQIIYIWSDDRPIGREHSIVIPEHCRTDRGYCEKTARTPPAGRHCKASAVTIKYPLQ